MGKNQLIHGNEFHLLKQAEIHKATGKLVESLNLAAGSTGGFDIYKVVEAYFTDLDLLLLYLKEESITYQKVFLSKQPIPRCHLM